MLRCADCGDRSPISPAADAAHSSAALSTAHVMLTFALPFPGGKPLRMVATAQGSGLLKPGLQVAEVVPEFHSDNEDTTGGSLSDS